MSLIWGKKHTKSPIFNIKSIGEWIFFLPFITVLDMSKISNNIDFDALLVFVQHQILEKKTP